MNKNTLRDYVNLCKKNDIELILQISNEIDNSKSKRQIAKKYSINMNEINSIEQIKNNHNSSIENPLEYIYNKYKSFKNIQTGGNNNNNNNSKNITCPCCDCSKDGYIFSDNENQKCER